MTVYTAAFTEADVAVPVACFGVLFLVALAVAGSLKQSARHRATEPDESVTPATGQTVDLAASLGYPVTSVYREAPLVELESRANTVPGWLASGAYPPAHLPVDPRQKES